MAKKAAPVIGAGLGFLYGGPMLGSAIGGGLGSLIAGKKPEDALKFAAMAIMREGIKKGTINPSALKTPSIFSKATGLVKANPLKSAMLALGLGAAAKGGEESETIDIEKVYGTQSPFRDLGQADIGPNRLVPYGSSTNPYGLAHGGIISLAQGGDFPRKNGPIAGPGTETSDEVPAMLSDGEFVVNAKTVRGLGSRLGGQGRKDERERGSKYLYDMQNRYGRA